MCSSDLAGVDVLGEPRLGPLGEVVAVGVETEKVVCVPERTIATWAVSKLNGEEVPVTTVGQACAVAARRSMPQDTSGSVDTEARGTAVRSPSDRPLR